MLNENKTIELVKMVVKENNLVINIIDEIYRYVTNDQSDNVISMQNSMINLIKE